MKYHCVTDFGDVLIPSDDAIRMLQTVADDLCSRGRRLGYFTPQNPILNQYCDFINQLAGQVYARHGRLKIAPPLGAWLRHRAGSLA